VAAGNRGTTGDGLDDLVKLSFFSEIGKAIASTFTLQETVSCVMEQIGNIFAPSYWSLLLKKHATGELKFVHVVGSGVEDLNGKVLPKGSGIAGWIAEHGEAVIIEDVSRDKRFNPEIDKMTNFTTESIIGVPLKSRGKIFGVIELINKLDGSSFTSFELKLLQTVADYAAIAIEKCYYFRSLQRMASIDPLTGLYNRRFFHRHLEKELERAKRSGESFTLVLIDVDKFKTINDSLGHTAGDKVLIAIADALRKTVRKADVACRLGGDEFLILMPEAGVAHAEKLKKRVNAYIAKSGDELGIGFSVSFGIHEGTASKPEEALDFVDRRMYEEKERKSERYVLEMERNISEYF
jgi:diguanylate cyclase (GGDEF)-like protein